jgi:hypothetical protein
MAPVAAENERYGRLLVSDLRKARAFASYLVAKATQTNENDVRDQDVELLMRWAFKEARNLLKLYGDVQESLTKYMETRVASVGECVQRIEEDMV